MIPSKTEVKFKEHLGCVIPAYHDDHPDKMVVFLYGPNDKGPQILVIPEEELEIVGSDPAVAEYKACGAGQGADCCIFLVAGAQGFECARFSGLHKTLLDRRESFVSKRMPTERWPNCYLKQPVEFDQG